MTSLALGFKMEPSFLNTQRGSPQPWHSRTTITSSELWPSEVSLGFYLLGWCHHCRMPTVATACLSHKTVAIHGCCRYWPVFTDLYCDAPKPGGSLTTRQPAEYSWMLGNPILLMKIGQSLLCTRSFTQSTKSVPTIYNDYTGST